MLEIDGYTKLVPDVVGAIPAILQRCIYVSEREKEKGFIVFSKDALNPGIFLISPGNSYRIWKLLKTLLDLKKKKKRYDYTVP